ncbi:hypothetical protein MPLDJ20_130007 [Mesorhizobium plurifarium]|uniref:Uncharacterized protein n=1 Tax=Mesorhizobium plurifarium TaxID=69974 RepID=A0A090EI77_MESPL|nr:hypothetical protein MPLDJ20_130007 [Mesorhizobium plurifarium]
MDQRCATAFQQIVSKLHMPIDVDIETALDVDVKSWLAFAVQKTDEVVVLALALAEGQDEIAGCL